MAIIAKYKIDTSIQSANTLPTFNQEFEYSYNDVVDDEVNAPGIVTRTIESTSLPSEIRFANMSSMIELISVDISNLVSLDGMFYGCDRLTSLDLSDWDVKNITSMQWMFQYCYHLTEVNLNNWNPDHLTTVHQLFATCPELVTVHMENFNMSNVTMTSEMFVGCTKLTTVNGLNNWDISKVMITRDMFHDCSSLVSLDVSSWDTGNVTNMSYMFEGCFSLVSLDVSKWNVSKVKYMSDAFNGCTKLAQLDVSNWDTSSVERLNGMFLSCRSLAQLDVSKWNTSSLTTLNSTFTGCSSLTQLDASNWDTSNVTLMTNTFFECRSLTQLDVSNWDTSSVTNMNSMFRNCQSLTSLDISNWSTIGDATTVDYMLSGDLSLTDIGMIYCDESVINKIASVASELTCNIWVGEDADISSLTTYDNISYKLYGKTREIQLNSPLLEKDKLVIKDGKLCHYHVMTQLVLDGSRHWNMNQIDDTKDTVRFYTSSHTTQGIALKSPIYCDRLPKGLSSWDKPYISLNTASDQIFVAIHKSELPSLNSSEFRKWLQSNPLTIAYELETPYYEVISDDPLYLDLFKDSVDVVHNSDVPINMDLTDKSLLTVAMRPSTEYTIAVDKSNPDSNISVNLNGMTTSSTGNIIRVTTPESMTSEQISFVGGSDISNIRIIQGAQTESTVPKMSHRGLQSSFESNLVTDESSPHYNKYEVKYKIAGKNKFDGIFSIESGCYQAVCEIEPNTVYTVSYDRNYSTSTNEKRFNIYLMDESGNWLSAIIVVDGSNSFTSPPNARYLRVKSRSGINLMDINALNFQLEEGSTATPYEPYKGCTKTFYLNSPLLEGDTIEDINGKATHVRRSTRIIVDSSISDIQLYKNKEESPHIMFRCKSLVPNHLRYDHPATWTGVIHKCDRLPSVAFRLLYTSELVGNGVALENSNPGNAVIALLKTELSTLDSDGLIEWLQSHPLTIEYKLRYPIYEEISDDSIVCESFSGTKLNLRTNIPPIITPRGLKIVVPGLQDHTNYSVKFLAYQEGTVLVRLGDTTPTTANVTPGWNTVIVRSGARYDPTLEISGDASNYIAKVSVVATVMEYDHFTGVQSTFESELVNAGDYAGKYRVRITTYDSLQFGIGGKI